jgi:hypothetical protein
MASPAKWSKKQFDTRVELLAVRVYRGVRIYLRRIGVSMFEYMFPYHGQIYTTHYIFYPTPGKKNLTEDQVNNSAAQVFTVAVTTIEELQKQYGEFENNPLPDVQPAAPTKPEKIVN